MEEEDGASVRAGRDGGPAVWSGGVAQGLCVNAAAAAAAAAAAGRLCAEVGGEDDVLTVEVAVDVHAVVDVGHPQRHLRAR